MSPLSFNSIFANSTCRPDLSEKIFLGSIDTDTVWRLYVAFDDDAYWLFGWIACGKYRTDTFVPDGVHVHPIKY